MTTPVPTAYMIDAAGTRDRDDAIAATSTGDGWAATVWIADPTALVPAGDDRDKAAFARGWTRYLPDGRTVPMLGRDTEAAASLDPDRDNPALRVDLTIDATGHVLDTAIRRDILRGAAALPYDTLVDALRSGGHAPLRVLLGCATVMQRARQDAGALTWLDPSTRWVVDEDGAARPLPAATIVQAYLIVSEFMVAANTAIATWAAARDIPILFRNQRAATVGPPRQEILDDVAAHAAADSWAPIAARLNLILRRATYDGYVAGHWALNVPAYTHATSPLRRYADLVTMRQVHAALDGDPLPYTAEQVQAVGDTLTQHAVEIAQARSERNSEKNRSEKRRLVAAAAGADQDAARAVFAAADPAKLFRLLKTAARDGTLSTVPALVDEAEARFADGRFGAREAHLLLLSDETAAADAATTRLQHSALAMLAANPALAVSTLDMHRLTHGWPPVARTVASAGPSHAPLFRVTSTVDTGDTVLSGAPRTAAGKKDAAARADLSLLCAVAGTDDVSTDAETNGDLPLHALGDGDFGSADDDRNPISVLNEWAQARRLPQPVFQAQMTGPSHQPTFTATVTVSGVDIEGVGSGDTKQAARAAAAAAFLTRLTPQ